MSIYKGSRYFPENNLTSDAPKFVRYSREEILGDALSNPTLRRLADHLDARDRVVVVGLAVGGGATTHLFPNNDVKVTQRVKPPRRAVGFRAILRDAAISLLDECKSRIQGAS